MADAAPPPVAAGDGDTSLFADELMHDSETLFQCQGDLIQAQWACDKAVLHYRFRFTNQHPRVWVLVADGVDSLAFITHAEAADALAKYQKDEERRHMVCHVESRLSGSVDIEMLSHVYGRMARRKAKEERKEKERYRPS